MWFDRKPQPGSAPAAFPAIGGATPPRLTQPPWIVRTPHPGDSDPPPRAASDLPPATPLTLDPLATLHSSAPAMRDTPEFIARRPQPERDEHAIAAEEAERRELHRQQQDAVARLYEAIDELTAVRAALSSDMEHQLVQLAGKIARKVVQRELTVAPDILLELAREGIDALGEKGNIVVRLGAVIDEQTTNEFLARIGDRAPGCRVLFDGDLAPGSCVVEGQAGHVDESIDERLDNVMRSVLADHSG